MKVAKLLLLVFFALLALFFNVALCKGGEEKNSGNCINIYHKGRYKILLKSKALFGCKLVHTIHFIYTACRIVGGCFAKKGEFPWVIGIWRKHGTRPFCGGSIIGKRYVY